MNMSRKQAPAQVVTPESIADSVGSAGLRAPEAVAQYALGLGDDALILAHRLGEWISNAPELEEDIALGNIGLDLLGHARSLLSYAGSAWGKSEDDLAYFRDEPEFRCRQLFEQPIGDFGHTIARQLIASVYFNGLYRQLTASSDNTLAAIAAKAIKEVDYHLDHSTQWLMRLGQGTDESNRRMQAGLTAIWPFVDELFRPEPNADELAGIAADSEALRNEFDALVPKLLEDAGLEVPPSAFARGGGREGVHSEAFGPLLAEMQVLARAHPGAKW
ncbi:Phenylacetate-CoA oxygenase, PaaI subunit [Microbacterium esteraromaticum]|uniref:Phenylacetate-CoA oxygenase, PaaI subunit n=1 Tax=Microbacterium esteraromaticum TaxID=57043 RepID=A0A1R4KCG1_9MICO|nr:1,2-phenylacetyl-CoA epoxidase subunit PaaC [Microbacterium esteraromaticum]SJN41703.1 Phenylacetate-CoA oxygenase, PaaI subunit [Microbacterium esteraromaticum]